MARKINIRDDDETVINNTSEHDYPQKDHGTNWLPLLIIPLLVGGLLWGLQSYSQNAVRDSDSTPQYGVGGGPMVTQGVTATPTVTMTPTPSVSPTPVEGNTDIVPTMEISPTNMGGDSL